MTVIGHVYLSEAWWKVQAGSDDYTAGVEWADVQKTRKERAWTHSSNAGHDDDDASKRLRIVSDDVGHLVVIGVAVSEPQIMPNCAAVRHYLARARFSAIDPPPVFSAILHRRTCFPCGAAN